MVTYSIVSISALLTHMTSYPQQPITATCDRRNDIPLADLGDEGTPPSLGPILIFMQFLGKIDQLIAPPPPLWS